MITINSDLLRNNFLQKTGHVKSHKSSQDPKMGDLRGVGGGVTLCVFIEVYNR